MQNQESHNDKGFRVWEQKKNRNFIGTRFDYLFLPFLIDTDLIDVRVKSLWVEELEIVDIEKEHLPW